MNEFRYRRIEQMLDEWEAMAADDIAADEMAHIRVRRLMTAAGIEPGPRLMLRPE